MTIKSFIPFIIFIFICQYSFSQQLFFSERVDKSGQPSGVSDAFTISKFGGYVNVMFRDSKNFETDSLHFEIYLNGKYFSVLSSKVKKDWDYLYHKIMFKIPGIYTIYVLDDKRKELVFDKLKIEAK